MKFSILEAATVASALVWAQAAYAHGIAGNRFFGGTLRFDDPAVVPSPNEVKLHGYRHRPVMTCLNLAQSRHGGA